MGKQTINEATKYLKEWLKDGDYVENDLTKRLKEVLFVKEDKDFKIGDKVHISRLECINLGISDNVEFTIRDILSDNLDFPIVLNADEFGKDWVEFFKEEDLIKS